MFSTKFIFRTSGSSLRNWILPALLIVCLLTVCLPCQAHAETPADQKQEAAIESNLHSGVENLVNIQQSIELKRDTIRELIDQLNKLEDTFEKQEFENKIGRIKNEISSLKQSFEHIALGGVNQSMLTDQPEQKIDWREEIEQVSRPLLSTLKELTAKPRQIDSLRRDIERRQDQLLVIEKALESIRFFKTQALPPVTSESVNQLLNDWEQRRVDAQRTLEIATFKLNSLQTESESWYTSTAETITEFFRGRGLTLFLAITISLLIWLVSKGLLSLYWRWLARNRDDGAITRAPLVYYSHRLATAIIIVLALLMVFYVRGDVLFLTLALIALVGAALTLRQTLPRYLAEIRLLLGVGPVREQERLVLDGIPFLVESLSVYTVLRNPALEGAVRMPLHTMNSLTSRPFSEEPWFPCQAGDHILLADGNIGKVVRQTIELVEILILDTMVQIRTQDFLSQNNRNLTRHGFGIVGSFGIDYQHQAICLDTVPARFREAIITKFKDVGMGDDIVDIIVEFKEAGASSLDYRIYITLHSRAANAYFKVQRMVQQACVDACNREGWVIPFTQITVHSSSTDEEPGQHKATTTDDITRAVIESLPRP